MDYQDIDLTKINKVRMRETINAFRKGEVFELIRDRGKGFYIQKGVFKMNSTAVKMNLYQFKIGVIC